MKAMHKAGIKVYPIDRYFTPSETANLSPEELLDFFVTGRNKILIGSVKYFAQTLKPHEKFACLLGVGHYPILGTHALNIPHVIVNSEQLAHINPDHFIHELNKELYSSGEFDLSPLYQDNFYLDITDAQDDEYLVKQMESVILLGTCPDWLPQSNRPTKTKVDC